MRWPWTSFGLTTWTWTSKRCFRFWTQVVQVATQLQLTSWLDIITDAACGGNYTSENGTITSPGFPGNYPTNAECVWIINVAPGNSLSLTFDTFAIEDNPHCDTDYLEIREKSGVGKLVGAFCGNSIDSLSSSSTLWIKFRSDASSSDRGFSAEYGLQRENEIFGTSGTIASPMYPIPYKRLALYTYRITVEIGFVVRLSFHDFHLETDESEDFVAPFGSLKVGVVWGGFQQDKSWFVL